MLAPPPSNLNQGNLPGNVEIVYAPDGTHCHQASFLLQSAPIFSSNNHGRNLRDDTTRVIDLPKVSMQPSLQWYQLHITYLTNRPRLQQTVCPRIPIDANPRRHRLWKRLHPIPYLTHRMLEIAMHQPYLPSYRSVVDRPAPIVAVDGRVVGS